MSASRCGDNCGTCHFYGGGGDAVKHGDLDSSMAYPEKDIDIHMGLDGQDFACQECHVTKEHIIPGQLARRLPGRGEPAQLRGVSHRFAAQREPAQQSRRQHRLPDLPYPGLLQGSPDQALVGLVDIGR